MKGLLTIILIRFVISLVVRINFMTEGASFFICWIRDWGKFAALSENGSAVNEAIVHCQLYINRRDDIIIIKYYKGDNIWILINLKSLLVF